LFRYIDIKKNFKREKLKKMVKLILVTGGSGYIGTHCLVELLKDGYNVFVIDNECNSSFESLKRVELISGKQVPYAKLNLNDKEHLNALFKANQFYAVLHLAAFKAVGESTSKPLEYYSNNVSSTICLLEVLLIILIFIDVLCLTNS